MENQTLIKEICPTSAWKRAKSGALLVDVREKEEILALAFDVPDILHIPLSELEERFTEIPKERDVILVCKGGSRSLRATAFLQNHGYTNAVNMQFGLARWVQKGFPVTGDTSVVTGSDSCCSSTGCC